MFNDEEIKNIRFMDFFKEKLDEIEVENNEKLPFVGGAYGTMAYDIIREFENIPNNNPDELKVPDSDMFFVREGVIYDHYHEKITIVILVEEGEEKKGIARLEEIKNDWNHWEEVELINKSLVEIDGFRKYNLQHSSGYVSKELKLNFGKYYPKLKLESNIIKNFINQEMVKVLSNFKEYKLSKEIEKIKEVENNKIKNEIKKISNDISF